MGECRKQQNIEYKNNPGEMSTLNGFELCKLARC
jgi:hypothetical protein